MNRISTIDETVSWMNMNHINIIVMDITHNFYHATYRKGSKKFTDFKTGILISQPIGWMYLPTMNNKIEEDEIEILYS